MVVKRLLLFAVMILTSSLGIGYAQDSNPVDRWASVWLYDSDAVKINVLSTQGTPVLREFFPEIAPEYDVKPQEIALSPDGVSLAFALNSSTTGKEALFELSRSISRKIV